MLALELADLQLHNKKRGFEGSNNTHAGTSKSIRTPKKHKNICTIPQNSNNPQSTAECEIEGMNQRILKPAY